MVSKWAAAAIGSALLAAGCVSHGGDALNNRITSVSAIHASDLTPEGARRLGLSGRRANGPIVFNDLRCRDIRPEFRQRFPECRPRAIAYGGFGGATGAGPGSGPGPGPGPGSSGGSASASASGSGASASGGGSGGATASASGPDADASTGTGTADAASAGPSGVSAASGSGTDAQAASVGPDGVSASHGSTTAGF